MRITRWGEYGIHCSTYIASKVVQGVDLVSAQEIADSQAIPVDYARQILQRLKNGGIITTVRGPQGGYSLARPAAEISLVDILRAAEGETFELICETNQLDDVRCSPDGNCSLRPIWQKLRLHIDSFLGGYTLHQLLSSEVTMQNTEPILIGASSKK